MGSRFLVIREFDEFSRVLAEQGFDVTNLPLIETVPVEDFAELNTVIERLDSYDGLFVTSPKAGEVFLERLARFRDQFAGKIYVLGNRCQTLFELAGYKPYTGESAATAEELIGSFADAEFAGRKFLFVRGNKSRRTISYLLRDLATVDEIEVYRTIEKEVGPDLASQIREGFEQIGWVCFFSPSGVESFIRSFGKQILNNVRIAAIGSTTADAVRTNGLEVDFTASEPTAKRFAYELIDFIKKETGGAGWESLF